MDLVLDSKENPNALIGKLHLGQGDTLQEYRSYIYKPTFKLRLFTIQANTFGFF